RRRRKIRFQNGKAIRWSAQNSWRSHVHDRRPISALNCLLDFAVIVSEHNPEDNLEQKSAVDHARVIANCFEHSTVLPFRFGTVFSDDDALRRSVRSNQRQFTANVERLRGKAEMHLKVVFEDAGPDSPKYQSSPCVGKEYLSRLRETATVQRERQTKAKAVFVQVHRMFSPLEEDITC